MNPHYSSVGFVFGGHMEITNRFFQQIKTTFTAPVNAAALGIGRLNEIAYVRYMAKRVSIYCTVLDMNSTYADVAYKVDVCVMHGDDIEELIQVKSSQIAAENAAAALSSVRHTYKGIAYPIHVVYPDDNGTWRTVH